MLAMPWIRFHASQLKDAREIEVNSERSMAAARKQ